MPKRLIRVHGQVAYVPLTRGYVAVIDAADVPLVEGRNWSAVVDGQTVYAYGKCPDATGKPIQTKMHRHLLSAPSGVDVDHRNGDGLYNRRDNIRLATSSQNHCNRSISKANTSGFKGVSWDRQKGRWQARIKLRGQQTWLGYFDTAEDAHKAYAAAATKLHGDFARVA